MRLLWRTHDGPEVKTCGQRRSGAVLRSIHTVFSVGTVGGLTDGQLLERFATRDGEAAELAFAALVERHGPMVLRVCRGVLRDGHDAEDAFQATFLILARKARSVWVRDSLGPWLHGVAYHVATTARSTASRRRSREREAAEMRPRVVAEGDRDDLGGGPRGLNDSPSLSLGGRPLLPGGADPAAGRTTTGLAARDGPEPAGRRGRGGSAPIDPPWPAALGRFPAAILGMEAATAVPTALAVTIRPRRGSRRGRWRWGRHGLGRRINRWSAEDHGVDQTDDGGRVRVAIERRLDRARLLAQPAGEPSRLEGDQDPLMKYEIALERWETDGRADRRGTDPERRFISFPHDLDIRPL
ncbi:MAG: sigma-70 family RNA polymerase sigma factor [Singulisphaera sp.]